MFNERVLQITEDIMLKWRLLVEEGRRTEHTFSQPDLIIAATAIHHGLIVVTCDRSSMTGRACLPLINGKQRRPCDARFVCTAPRRIAVNKSAFMLPCLSLANGLV